MLIVDRQARTIFGRAIPWHVVALVNRRRFGLHADCLTWPELLHLVLCHDNSLIVGRAVDFESASDGLYATFRVRSGDPGDRALAVAEAGWGLSCSFDVVEYDDSGDVLWCIRGVIEEISLVPKPAFP
jgi:hypothetical protein